MTIPLFSNDDLMQDIKAKTFDPLVSSHNSLKTSHDNLTNRVGSAEGKISSMEGSVNTVSNDVFNLSNTVQILEGKVVDGSHLKTALANANLHALASDIKDTVHDFHNKITPTNAYKFFRVNNNGSGLETSYVDLDTSHIEDRIDVAEGRIHAVEINNADTVNRVIALENRPDADLTPVEDRLDLAEGTIANHENRIVNLELGGGGGSVDLTPVLDRLDTAEDKILAVETISADTVDRVVVLENKPDVDLTPIEDRLDSLETKPETDLGPLEKEVEDLKSAFDNMATIDSLQTSELANHKIRIENLEMGGGEEVDLTPLIERLDNLDSGQNLHQLALNNHEGRIDVLEKSSNIDWTPITDRLDAHDGVLEDHDDRLDVLENTPPVVVKNKFTELDDTPSGYFPGKLLGYNLSGTAIISVDKTFKSLSDTPNDFAGNARKAVVVNSGETALEFKEMPNLDPITTDVNNIHNDVLRITVEQTLQDNSIADHETRLDDLEAAPRTFTSLTDTPTTLTPNKYLVVNAAGSGITESTLSTSDVNGLAALAAGVVNGNALIHTKSSGTDTVLTGNNISQASFSASNIVIGTPTSGNTRTVSMGEIAPYQSTQLTATQVREGCQITVVNKGSGTLRLVPPTGHTIFAGSSSATEFLVPSASFCTLFPALYDNGEKRYITIACGKTNTYT